MIYDRSECIHIFRYTYAHTFVCNMTYQASQKKKKTLNMIYDIRYMMYEKTYDKYDKNMISMICEIWYDIWGQANERNTKP